MNINVVDTILKRHLLSSLLYMHPSIKMLTNNLIHYHTKEDVGHGVPKI